MINFAYIILGYILLVQVILFLLFSLPTPFKFKGKVVRALLGSRLMSSLMWVHLGLCIIAGMFYADLQQSQNTYNIQKQQIRLKGTGHVGSEVRINFLSYQVQRIQRNKYITFMVIYATIILNVYLRLLYHIYEKRGDFQGQPTLSEKTAAVDRSSAGSSVPTQKRQSSTVDRVSIETKKSK